MTNFSFYINMARHGNVLILALFKMLLDHSLLFLDMILIFLKILH